MLIKKAVRLLRQYREKFAVHRDTYALISATMHTEYTVKLDTVPERIFTDKRFYSFDNMVRALEAARAAYT